MRRSFMAGRLGVGSLIAAVTLAMSACGRPTDDATRIGPDARTDHPDAGVPDARRGRCRGDAGLPYGDAPVASAEAADASEAAKPPAPADPGRAPAPMAAGSRRHRLRQAASR